MSDPNASLKPFGTVRSFLWPIHNSELRKFLPMQLMLVLICFNYSILRNLKDSIVITNSGAEVIPFMKMCLLPMAVLITVLFSKLSNRYSQERVFYIMMSIFLSFFALFSIVLYPMREILHPHASAQVLKELIPCCKWFVTLYEHWIYTAFYVMAELWAAMILNVCFWGFANEITRVPEARRFYGVLGIGSNIAAALAGFCSICFVKAATTLSNNSDLLLSSLSDDAEEALWQQQLSWMMAIVILFGLLTMVIFRWMNNNVLKDPCYDDLHQVKKNALLERGKKKQSLRDSLRYLKNSNYLICIAIMVVAYNLSIHLVELVWKDQLKQLYPTKTDYMRVLSYLTLSMGIIATLAAFCMPRFINRLGWTFTAMITPITMMCTSASFFIFLLYRENLSPLAVFLGSSPLAIAVYIGFAQNCFSKAAKYSVFDATTQMAFIPLDHNSKLKGKAAIDGIGSRLGKTGGSIIHTGLLMIFHTLSASSPYVAWLLLAVICGWVVAIKALGVQFNLLTLNSEKAPEGGDKVEAHPTTTNSNVKTAVSLSTARA